MQYSKVEICGVNTGKLKVLKESEKRELLTIMHNGTKKERAEAREKMTVLKTQQYAYLQQANGQLRLRLSPLTEQTTSQEAENVFLQCSRVQTKRIP